VEKKVMDGSIMRWCSDNKVQLHST